MRRFIRLIAVATLIVSAIACAPDQGEPTPIQPGDGPLLKIDAQPAGDYTRATDTAFEVGDSFGLFAIKGEGFDNLTTDNFADVLLSLEAWITNAKYTKGNNGFSGDQEYKWYEGEEVSTFLGLYPYQSDCTAADILVSGVEFCVKSDQSTHAGYTASDLMAAYKDGVAPTDQTITLSFDHLLSKLVIDLNNQTGEEIAEVYVDGVKGNFTYSLINATPTGNYGTIKAGELATPTEGFTDTFVLIIPPQSAAPKVAITTTSGKQYTFDAPEELNFGTSKKRQITVTLTAESISTNFDAIVNDWSADESVEFKDQPGGSDTPDSKSGYKVIVADKEYLIEESANGGWGTILLPIYADVNEFQIIDNATGKSLGGEMVCSAMRINLKEDVEKVTLPVIGEYVEYEFTITTEGEGAPYATLQPRLIGEFNEFLGTGLFYETYLMGIVSTCHVLKSPKGDYLFFTPMQAASHTAKLQRPENFKDSENTQYATTTPYVIISTNENVYNGWPITEVTCDRAIYPGVMFNYNDSWYDYSYIRTVYDVEKGELPFNRVVSDNGGAFQLNMPAFLQGLGALTTGTNNRLFTFCLPGTNINDCKYEMVRAAKGSLAEDGSYIGITLYADRDVHKLGYAIFSKLNIDNTNCKDWLASAESQGHLSYADLEQNGQDKSLGMTFSNETGEYTLLLAGYDAEGNMCSSSYLNFYYEQPHSDVECQNISMTVSKDTMRPDTEICIEMKGSNITSAYYSCLPAAQFGSLSDSELKVAAMQNYYKYLEGYLDYVNDMGYTESFVRLQPSTEYVVFGWFEDSAGGYSFIRNNITTDAATQWTLLGKGMYYDSSWQFSQEGALERYGAEVNIYQDADGSAHYRIEDPYGPYWDSYPSFYKGYRDKWLELAVYSIANSEGAVCSPICFDPHKTGMTATYSTENDSSLILEHGFNSLSGTQHYPMRDKGFGVYTNGQNKLVSEGVLQLAPWYNLEGTNVGYNYSQSSECIIITLPGYSFEFTPTEDTTTESAAAFNGKRDNSTRPAIFRPASEGGYSGSGGRLNYNHKVKIISCSSLEGGKEL